jgi:putative membrane protein
MSDRLPKAERQKVTLAIKKAELLTSGEIVVIAAKQSDDYIHVPIHAATGLALATPLLLPFFAIFFPWATVSLSWFFVIQLSTFIVTALALSYPALRYAITPKSLMHKYAHRAAASQFLAVNAHGTQRRTGVLIYVSLLERYSEIIGDTAIASKVDHKVWVSIIDEMRPHLRSGELTQALIHAVERCGKELAAHFPPGAENPNELPDRFIVL